MIRLDAATFLLQWAVGGLFFTWVTTRRREVGLGYGWLMRGVFGAMALASVLVAQAIGPVPVRDGAAVGVALAGLAAFAVYAWAGLLRADERQRLRALLRPGPRP